MSKAASNKAGPRSTTSEVPVPASEAHPSQRWEAAFVYAFICKFTNLRKNVEGFESPMDFEQALMFNGSDPIMRAILAAFIQNLKPGSRDPQTRIEKYLFNVLDEYCNKENERSLWWDEDRRRNFNPLVGTEGYFSLQWEEKLLILRQLVEWQLTYSVRIRDMIDLAWGVKASKHQKKTEKEVNAPPPPEHPESKESLRLDPYGQDVNRKRFWVLDDSPRIYQSGNPWKALCPFDAVSSSRDGFIGVIEDLKSRAFRTAESEEAAKPTKSRSKLEHLHLSLIQKLENEQLPVVDAEISRIEKARKRFEQKLLLAAQVEVRSTRTRRQTRKPDYVYDYNEADDNDDEYAYNTPDDDFIDDMDIDEDARSYAGSSSGMRRSSRSSVVNMRKRASEDTNGRNKFGGYRGERRSTRLGNAPAIAFDESEQVLLPPKRAKSHLSEGSDAVAAPQDTSTPETGLAPRLVVIPPPLGKKKSKFWYYAVEPGLGSSVSAEATPTPPIGAPGGGTGGNSAAASEVGVSLVDALDGVGLTDAKPATQQLTNGAPIAENGDHTPHGLNGDSKQEPSPGSDMSMSDGDF